MSKNYFRTQLRKLGKGGKEKKSRGKPSSPTFPDTSIPSTSPAQIQTRRQSHGTDSPVHASLLATAQMPKPESSYSLASNVSQTSLGLVTAVPRLNISEEPLDRQEVISITVDVQNFVAAISRLRKSMEDLDNAGEDKAYGSADDDSVSSNTQSTVLNDLKDLIQVVYSCLDQYQGMQSTEIKNAATELMKTFQNCGHVSASRCPACNSAIDVLIDAFTNSIQVFLTGDQQEPPLPPQRKLGGAAASTGNLLKGLSKSHDNLVPRYSSCLDLTQHFSEPIVDEIDQALAGVENNVDVAARYIKMRSRYNREVTSYLSKRGQIEYRYQQEMQKLTRKTHTALSDLKQQEECLPLVDLFQESVDQDLRFASNCSTTFSVQVGSRVVEPLEQKVVEIERVKKDLTHTWHRELKKLTDARAAMKNARAKYHFLGQDMTRIKTVLSAEPHGKQAEKRKKEVMELETKWNEAMTAYKNAVQVCNECQYQVHKSAQQSILCAYRRLVLDFDRELKSKLETYFQLQHNFFLPIPDVMDSYAGTVQEYEIGHDFMHYIERHPKLQHEPEDYQFEEFNPEDEDIDSQYCADPELPHIRASSSSDTFLSNEERMSSPQSLQAWDLEENSGVSPRMVKKDKDKTRPSSMAFLLEPFPDVKSSASGRRNSDNQPTSVQGITSPLHTSDVTTMSKNALTHTFKRLRTPSRCRECDNYVYFNGYECETCGLECHKKCLKPLAIRCGNKRLDRKLTIFGIDFLKHLKVAKRSIPMIVTKCIKEIEERGLNTHGLYRISTTKTKLEHQCQLFESGADRVDLSDCPPHLIASCLKLYFRQLPEPILTFDLYCDMLSFARDASHILPCNFKIASKEKEAAAVTMISTLRELLSHLDYKRYITLARLLFHLNRVSNPDNIQFNAMPPSNLGIVFGPTLLRRRESVTPLSLLADMTAQAKAIEILISHAHDVFNVKEEELLREEEIDYEQGECTQERLVDGHSETISSQTLSPETYVDENYATDSRTPFGTPPQQRRENISELGDVLDAFQCAGYISSPQPIAFHQSTSDIVDHSSLVTPGNTSVPGDSVCSLWQRHPNIVSLNASNKTLIPVGDRFERTAKTSNSYNEEIDVNTHSSRKNIDPSLIIESVSGLSFSGNGATHDVDSEEESIRDFDDENICLLSAGNPPHPLLASCSNMDNLLSEKHCNNEVITIGSEVEAYTSHSESLHTEENHLFATEKCSTPMKRSKESSSESILSLPIVLDASAEVVCSFERYGSTELLGNSSHKELQSRSPPQTLQQNMSYPDDDSREVFHAASLPTSAYSQTYDDDAQNSAVLGLSPFHVPVKGNQFLTDPFYVEESQFASSTQNPESRVTHSKGHATLKNAGHMITPLDLDYNISEKSSNQQMPYTLLFSSRNDEAVSSFPSQVLPLSASTSEVETVITIGNGSESEDVTNYDLEHDHLNCEIAHKGNVPSLLKEHSNEVNSNSTETPPIQTETGIEKQESSAQTMTLSPKRKITLSHPWHDKTRKIRINPLRVLKVPPTVSDITSPTEEYGDIDLNRIRMVSPEEISTKKPSEGLRRSKSCGILERTTTVSLSESLQTISECLEPASVLECPSNLSVSQEEITSTIRK